MSKEFSDQEREAIQDRIQVKKVKRNEKNKYKKIKKVLQMVKQFCKRFLSLPEVYLLFL